MVITNMHTLMPLMLPPGVPKIVRSKDNLKTSIVLLLFSGEKKLE